MQDPEVHTCYFICFLSPFFFWPTPTHPSKLSSDAVSFHPTFTWRNPSSLRWAYMSPPSLTPKLSNSNSNVFIALSESNQSHNGVLFSVFLHYWTMSSIRTRIVCYSFYNLRAIYLYLFTTNTGWVLFVCQIICWHWSAQRKRSSPCS